MLQNLLLARDGAVATVTFNRPQVLNALDAHSLRALHECGKRVIAAVNGSTLAGGCELVMSGALRAARQTAGPGQPEIDLGLMAAIQDGRERTRAAFLEKRTLVFEAR